MEIVLLPQAEAEHQRMLLPWCFCSDLEGVSRNYDRFPQGYVYESTEPVPMIHCSL